MINQIAYCGLACCICSENQKCPSCQAGGCDIHGWCKNYNCCREKELNGCWECNEFPCSGGMLDKPRIRAFAHFANDYGTEELARCLLRNKENGIKYHYDGQLVGDYDLCKTEEEIIEMIKYGHGAETNYVIEQLRIEDYSKCGNIWNMESDSFTQQFYEEIKSGNRLVFIYKINGVFIGEGALVLQNDDLDYTILGQRVYLSRMIVKPEYRNQGIGSTILDYLINKAVQMGFGEISLGVDKDNQSALHLYRKKGFNEVIFEGKDEYGEYYKLLKKLG